MKIKLFVSKPGAMMSKGCTVGILGSMSCGVPGYLWLDHNKYWLEAAIIPVIVLVVGIAMILLASAIENLKLKTRQKQ